MTFEPGKGTNYLLSALTSPEEVVPGALFEFPGNHAIIYGS